MAKNGDSQVAIDSNDADHGPFYSAQAYPGTHRDACHDPDCPHR